MADSIDRLIEEFSKLPGIGKKTAQRLAFYVLRIKKDEAKILAQAIMEHEKGMTPTYDFHRFSPDHALGGIQEGIFEIVDWAPLITADTNPEAVMGGAYRGLLVIDTDFQGCIYNPDKVAPEDVHVPL